MASSKEMQQSTRPLTHRPSLSSNSLAGSTNTRNAHSRTNSHSVAAGSVQSTHRVSRRKSITAANIVAVAAALDMAEDSITALPIAVSSRRNTMSKNGGSRSVAVGSLPSPPASLPAHKFLNMDGKLEHQDSAIDDGLNDNISADEGETFQQARVRRASDGQPLAQEGRKSNRKEIRCNECGKGYKHHSCLTKHLWEHRPEWSITSRFLISKHQQVQLLEAATVLLNMNHNATTPPDSARDFNSDQESVSPSGFDGSSEQLDGRSSVDTTPPPQFEGMDTASMSYRSLANGFSRGSGISQSFQSTASIGSIAGSVPNGSEFGYYRQQSHDRPPSAGMNSSGEADNELAAAFEQFSCSHNSNGGSRAGHLPPDVPPVPMIPVEYQNSEQLKGRSASYLEHTSLAGTSFINSFPSRAPESFTRSSRHHEEDIHMLDGEDDDDMQSQGRSDEDDAGFFGRMDGMEE